MPKANKTKLSSLGMPKAPWVYISDPTPGSKHAKELAALIPIVLHFILDRAEISPGPKIPKDLKSLVLITDPKSDHDNCQKIKTLKEFKQSAINMGANFASINIMNDMSKISEIDQFGTNHLNVAEAPGIATKIYKWLFTVLSVRETLYLIPEEQMKKIDEKLFPDYAYCPVNESQIHPKDAKIQFVALVMSKPQITEGKKLIWSVADRTGVATFYFQWRGPASQYTWDWVLGLKPGDRKALPRMPCIEVKEKKRIRVIKAPFRLTGAVISGTGCAIKAAGRCVCKVGKALQMGPSSKWVLEADVGPDGKMIDWSKVKDGPMKVEKPTEKKTIDVFNDNGEKNWNDDASVASTDVGSEFDEKTGKDFV